jgi:hypothetical protein
MINMVKKFETFINESKDYKQKEKQFSEMMPALHELIEKVNEERKGKYFAVYKDVPEIEDKIVAFVCANKGDKLIVLSKALEASDLKGNVSKYVKDIAQAAKKNDIDSHYDYSDNDDDLDESEM